jgi:hypothetical protein
LRSGPIVQQQASDEQAQNHTAGQQNGINVVEPFFAHGSHVAMLCHGVANGGAVFVGGRVVAVGGRGVGVGGGRVFVGGKVFVGAGRVAVSGCAV